jgi:hypothetical protein
MPDNLKGTGNGLVSEEEGWVGVITGEAPASVDYSASSFSNSTVASQIGPVDCEYTIVGKNKDGNPTSSLAILYPGNSNYQDLYNYSLTGGGTWSKDISVNIIASDK